MFSQNPGLYESSIFNLLSPKFSLEIQQSGNIPCNIEQGFLYHYILSSSVSIISDIGILTGKRLHLIVILIYISWIKRDEADFLIYLLAIHMSLRSICSFHFPIFMGLVVSLFLSFVNECFIDFVLAICQLYGMSKVLFYSVMCLYILASFIMQYIFSLA